MVMVGYADIVGNTTGGSVGKLVVGLSVRKSVGAKDGELVTAMEGTGVGKAVAGVIVGKGLIGRDVVGRAEGV
jgi:hypothetical protein